jgi:hypothetical protein
MARMGKVKVVGLTFRNRNGAKLYPANVHRIAELLQDAQIENIRQVGGWGDLRSTDPPKGPKVLLVRQPDNEADPNAIQVHVPALGPKQWVGFIPAPLAARWAKRMDSGRNVLEAFVSHVPVTPGIEEKPGLEIAVIFHEPDCDWAIEPHGSKPCSCMIRDNDYPEWTT